MDGGGRLIRPERGPTRGEGVPIRRQPAPGVRRDTREDAPSSGGPTGASVPRGRVPRAVAVLPVWLVVLVVLVVLALGACNSSSVRAQRSARSSSRGTATTGSVPTRRSLAARLCASGPATTVGRVASDDLTELSGLAAEGHGGDRLWAVQDSGNPAALFALDASGANLGAFRVSGAENHDWEDIAVAPDGHVLIADIGDNSAARDTVTIYDVTPPAHDVDHGTLVATPSRYRYPDGPRDAETLLVDPTTGDRYVVTKAWHIPTLTLYPEAVVFELPAPVAGSVGSAVEVGRIPLGRGVLVTGGDIAPDGRTIALRTSSPLRQDPAIHVYDRAAGHSVADALEGAGCVINGPEEEQGEAVTFADGGTALLTASEGEHSPIQRIDAAR